MSSVEITVMSKDEMTKMQNSTLLELQKLFVAINKLPNQIVGPSLDEIYRNLQPISDTTTQLKADVALIKARLVEISTGLPALIKNETMTAVQIEMVPQLRLLNERLDDVLTQHQDGKFNHEAIYCTLEMAALPIKPKLSKTERPTVYAKYKPEQVFDQLKAFKPKLYPVWEKLFKAAKKSYIEAPNFNCSTWTSREARAFKAYVRLFHKGHILDVGCGPYANPVYLQGLALEQLTAIEPLELVDEPWFPVVKGLNEFIPFKNNSFDTVVNATSLDHVIDVERALEETARVLSKNGHFIIWYANVKTAPNPMTNYNGPLDEYHLFHTNDEWFLPMLDRYFHTIDRKVFSASDTTDNVFACLTAKN